jgi:hypothetical protein
MTGTVRAKPKLSHFDKSTAATRRTPAYTNSYTNNNHSG